LGSLSGKTLFKSYQFESDPNDTTISFIHFSKCKIFKGLNTFHIFY